MRHHFPRAFLLLLATALLLGFSPRTDDPRPCEECHADLLEGAHGHDPVRPGNCGVCHKEGESIEQMDRGICKDCHGSIFPKGVKSRHPFIETYECDVCHLTHASEERYLLPVDPLRVCAPCHEDQLSSKSHPVGEELVDPRTGGRLTCTSSCHVPHASGKKHLLRELGSGPICKACHGEIY